MVPVLNAGSSAKVYSSVELSCCNQPPRAGLAYHSICFPGINVFAVQAMWWFSCQLLSACSPWYGPDRPKWLGPLPAGYPQHLQGEAPADYGYDLAGLGVDKAAFDRNFELEILHSRWAMLSALGILIPGELTTVAVCLLPGTHLLL